jgi:hypothetical protein
MVGAENRVNLLLQHWHGEPSSVEQASWRSIEAYAKTIGVEHRVLRGALVPGVTMPQMHKLHMLSEEFDQYDVVVMLDSDMFARPDAANICEASGIGVSGPLQAKLKASIRRRLPIRFRDKKDGDFYGGAIYRLERRDRQELRTHLSANILRDFDAYVRGLDEGVMHYLACRAGFIGRALVGGDVWACSSYAADRSNAHFVHIRRRVKEGSEERQGKDVALRNLVEAGVLCI